MKSEEEGNTPIMKKKKGNKRIVCSEDEDEIEIVKTDTPFSSTHNFPISNEYKFDSTTGYLIFYYDCDYFIQYFALKNG